MSIQVKAKGLKTEDLSKVDYSDGDLWYSVDPSEKAKPKFAKEGMASKHKTPPDTMINQLKKTAEGKWKNNTALAVERGSDGLPPPLAKDGSVPPAFAREDWKQWTWGQYHDEVRAAAKAYMSFGYPEMGTVNVWGFNAPEWKMAAFAGMFAGGKAAGIYPTDTPEVVAYKVVHSSGSILVVEDHSKAERVVKALNDRGDCVKLKAIVAWAHNPDEGATLKVEGCGDLPYISWKKLIELGKGDKVSDKDLDERIAGVDPQHCGILVYTSGTTGDPKAVMLSHDNCVFSSMNSVSLIGNYQGVFQAGEGRVMSYLPTSHVAGCINDFCMPACQSNLFKDGYTACYYARAYDIKKGTVGQRIAAVRPSAFFAVPLVYEKIADKIRAIGAAGSGMQQKLGNFGKEMNVEYARNIQLGGSGAAGGCCSCVGNFVGNKVKAAVGFDECKFFVSGAAPIRFDTMEYFGSLGIHINEGYGMSETTALSTIGVDCMHTWGSCGFEAPSTECNVFKIDPVDMNKKTECELAPDLFTTEEKYQGEICFHGRHVMMGYMACPEMGEDHKAKMIEKTAETIDREGWLHSGDKGLKTTLNMLRITGRYKELIIGAGGENIAPVPIEDSIKKLVPGINEVMMVGDKKKFNTCLITLKAVGANGETPGTDELDGPAKGVSPGVTTISAALKDKVWQETIQQAINETNENEKVCVNNAFRIGRFMILPTNFSEEGGELTPTKKLKRAVVEKLYAASIDKLYAADEGTYIPYA